MLVATRYLKQLRIEFDVNLPWPIDDVKSRPHVYGVRGMLNGTANLSHLGFGDAGAAEVAQELLQVATKLTALNVAGTVSHSALDRSKTTKSGQRAPHPSPRPSSSARGLSTSTSRVRQRSNVLT